MSIEERLERLELELVRAKRRTRWLLAAVALAVAIALAWTVIGAARTAQAYDAEGAKKVIRANGFTLEDENGKTCAQLGVTNDGASMNLYDEHGKVKATAWPVEK
jgi:predicted metal-binding membrane protein